MIQDLFGKTRYKVGLHTHTTLSDGRRTPEESAEIYRAAGYDAIAFTDHWHYGAERRIGDLPIFSGCEYNLGYNDGDAGSDYGVYHIVALGMREDPKLVVSQDGVPTPVQTVIDAIHAVGGLAVLAHPAWSLNMPDRIMKLQGIDATEIYNTVSGVVNSGRPDSSLIVDMLATHGRIYPLLATDDVHYYTTDATRSFVMVEAEACTQEAIFAAIRAGRFYASQGPEIHMVREGNKVIVYTSPVKQIGVYSNRVYAPTRFVRDGNYTRFEFEIQPLETFLRAEAVDENGNYAWTNIIRL